MENAYSCSNLTWKPFLRSYAFHSLSIIFAKTLWKPARYLSTINVSELRENLTTNQMMILALSGS